MRPGVGERGVVMVEFLIAIVPVFLVFLGAVQLLLFGAVRVVATHAAVAAARSAAVVLDDDPASYGGEPRGHLGVARDSTAPAMPGQSTPAGSVISALAAQASSRTRLDVIRRAADAPLAAFAPSPSQIARWFSTSGGGNVAEAISGSPLARTLFGMSLYDRAALALRIQSSPDAASSELVTVRLTYLAHCAIPLVAAVMCRSISALLNGSAEVRRNLGNVPAPELTRSFGLTGERFIVLNAVASYPRQRASYWGATGG